MSNTERQNTLIKNVDMQTFDLVPQYLHVQLRTFGSHDPGLDSTSTVGGIRVLFIDVEGC